jgi:hypothetical protein
MAVIYKPQQPSVWQEMAPYMMQYVQMHMAKKAREEERTQKLIETEQKNQAEEKKQDIELLKAGYKSTENIDTSKIPKKDLVKIRDKLYYKPPVDIAKTSEGGTIVTYGNDTKYYPPQVATDFDKKYDLYKKGELTRDELFGIKKPTKWEPQTMQEAIAYKNATSSMTDAELTKRALAGDKNAQAILDAQQKRKIEIAKATGQAQTEGRISGMDIDGTARAIIAGKENLDNVKNTFGVPVQEIVRKKVLEMDPEFNFNKPRVKVAAIKSSLTQQQKNRGMMGSFVKNISKQVDRMENIGKDIVSRLGIRALDLPKRELVRRAKGSANENIIQAYMKEIGAEIAKLSQGSAASIQQLPEENRKEWERIHDPNLSMKELMKILNETNQMANMRLDSVDDEITETIDLLDNIRTDEREPPPEEQPKKTRFKIIGVE